ncbi:MAG TPA: DUF937 domain-containing protein [Blastocatellia bacterium]|nr:DUF937 domain-containing protein [Blastocatellia bacterium]
MDLDNILNQALNVGTINQMSQVLGTDQGTTANAVQAALPMLLGAMAQNSSTSEGSSSLLSALDRDHDGSVLDDLAGFLGGYNTGPGQGILGHVFGDRLGAVESAVSRSSGMDLGRVASLLMMLAPIVMGALGQSRRQGEVNESSLPDILAGATRQTASNSPMSDMLSQMLDSNRDGSSLDDILRMAGNFFGKRGN